MSTMTGTTVREQTTTRQKVGLVLCGLFSLSNIPSFLEGGAGPGEDGPPEGILILGSILGVIGLVATILAWRGSRVALRVAAGAIIVETLTALPAFFVDVPMAIKALVGFSVVLTVAIVVLMFSTGQRPAAVTD